MMGFFSLTGQINGSEIYLHEVLLAFIQNVQFISGYQITTKPKVNCHVESYLPLS